jgi:hypothetical protein
MTAGILVTNVLGLGSGAIFLMWSLAALLSAGTVSQVCCSALHPPSCQLSRPSLRTLNFTSADSMASFTACIAAPSSHH